MYKKRSRKLDKGRKVFRGFPKTQLKALSSRKASGRWAMERRIINSDPELTTPFEFLTEQGQLLLTEGSELYLVTENS